jgi:16S rRNA processing protein RimM
VGATLAVDNVRSAINAMTSSANKPSRILLGTITGAHGIRGEVVIKAYTQAPENIAAYGPLVDKSGKRSFAITVKRLTSKGVVAQIEGITTRTAAQELKGIELHADRDSLPAIAESEFYYADLIGLTAIDCRGNTIGEIVSVTNYGAGDLLEVRLLGRMATELIPFAEAFVPQIDLAARRAVVCMPTIVKPDDANAEGAKESQGGS